LNNPGRSSQRQRVRLSLPNCQLMGACLDPGVHHAPCLSKALCFGTTYTYRRRSYLVIAFRNSHTGTSSPFAASSYSRRQQENVSTYLLTTAGRHAPWRPGLTAQPLRHRLAPCQSRIAGQVVPGSTSSRDPIRPFKLTSIPLLQTEQHGPLRVGHLRRPSFVGQLTMPLGAADARRLQPTGDHRGHICLSAMLCVRGRACYRARLLAGFGADLGR